MKLWAIYRFEDIKRNQVFINYLDEACKKNNINFEVMIFENFSIGIINNTLEIFYNNVPLKTYPDGIINRTNDYLIATQFENKGIRCFNNSFLTRIANNKNECYQYVCKANVKIQDTLFNSTILTDFPLILKNPLGRGGNEVYLIKNEEELANKTKEYKQYTLQKMCISNPSKDLRVYVVGNKIVASVLRKGINDFRANYSLSKNAEIYSLSKKEKEIVNKVIDLFNIDYASVDFLINDLGELVFNEIEDSAGARALYELSDINIADVYIKHIYNKIKEL